jgi:uncharacterized protein
MLTGFARYSRARSFVVVGNNWMLALFMAVGSIAGAYVGSLILGVVPFICGPFQ